MKIDPCRFITAIAIFFASAHSLAIDNNVVGEPQVTCSEDSVTFSVRSRNRFTGNVFIKGKYGVPSCRQEYFQNNFNGASFTVKIGECGMRRIRTLQPQGMNYVLVFVVNFHSQFITKIDRAYNVRCFYAQVDKTVTAQLDVSMITTAELNAQTMVMPNCQYSVRSGTLNGPTLRYARVGDRLVHRWECDNPSFGMLVKNCFVNDGQGSSVRVLDNRGCPVFTPVVQGTLNYDNGLNLAYVEVWAYKFPDRNNLFFQCQIQMCHKRENDCVGVTPPNCPLVLKSEFEGGGSQTVPGLDRTEIRGTFNSLNQGLPVIQPQPGLAVVVQNTNDAVGYGAPPINNPSAAVYGYNTDFGRPVGRQVERRQGKTVLGNLSENDTSVNILRSPDNKIVTSNRTIITDAKDDTDRTAGRREDDSRLPASNRSNKSRRALLDESIDESFDISTHGFVSESGSGGEEEDEETLDVTSEMVIIVDIEDADEEASEGNSAPSLFVPVEDVSVCLNPTSLGLLMAALTTLVIIIVLLLIYIVLRSAKDRSRSSSSASSTSGETNTAKSVSDDSSPMTSYELWRNVLSEKRSS